MNTHRIFGYTLRDHCAGRNAPLTELPVLLRTAANHTWCRSLAIYMRAQDCNTHEDCWLFCILNTGTILFQQCSQRCCRQALERVSRQVPEVQNPEEVRRWKNGQEREIDDRRIKHRGQPRSAWISTAMFLSARNPDRSMAPTKAE